MAEKSLAQLRKERDMLLNKSKIRTLKTNAMRAKELEKKRLKSEIKALRNPGSVAAKNRFKSLSRKTGAFLKKRGAIVAKNLDRLAEEEERARKRRK